MNNNFSTEKILDLQSQLCDQKFDSLDAASTSQDLWYFIERNHKCNQLLWGQEDLARRNDVDPVEIVKNKRAIDQYNQLRNDAIEKIDEVILSELRSVILKDGAQQNSESAGSMIDRMSILALKIKAVELQVKRPDVDGRHIELCIARLQVLNEQRQDLAAALDALMTDFEFGKRFYKVYRQYKMYNDPKFNVNIKQ